MSWLGRHWSLIFQLIGQHLPLSLWPVLIGLVIAIPLGWLANRYTAARAILVPTASILYTIPSIALLVFMPVILGTQTTSNINLIVALTVYTLALLVRSVADALSSVSDQVIAAATAVGYKPLHRFLTVELPLAVPVIVAGLRVATVSNISLVSVGAIIGNGGLGNLFTEGFQRDIVPEIVAGVLATLVLALIFDVLLLGAGRVLTPWTRLGR